MVLPKNELIENDEILDLLDQGVVELNQWIEEKDLFTSKDLEEHLKKSKSFVRNLLETLLKEEQIERMGKGRATKYKKK